MSGFEVQLTLAISNFNRSQPDALRQVSRRDEPNASLTYATNGRMRPKAAAPAARYPYVRCKAQPYRIGTLAQ